METKFEIGQSVFWATCRREENSVECPHCGGTGRLLVTFHDGSTVSIECNNCQLGYDPPSGRVRVYDRTPRANPVTITGLEIKADGTVEYRTNTSYIVDEDRVFDNYDDAMGKAQEMAVEQDKAEREKVFTKEKDTRSWAFNASYHRKEIERAKKSIAYHESKLAVASLKAKDQPR